MKKQFFWTFLTAMILIGITACGGGGGSDSGSIAGGGIGGTGSAATVSSGAITAKGSITVNGVKYETVGSRVFVEDTEFGDDSRLRVGMVVEVEGEVNADGRTGRASVVRFNDSVEGPITSLTPGTGEMEVLGQLVFVNDLTGYENTPGIAGLAVNDIVEVSGQFDAQGNIRATFVEKKQVVVAEYEITGFVSGKSGQTFFINSLRVDFSLALLEDFGGGEPQNGDYVEVKGLSTNYTPATTTLVASKVENKARVYDDGLEVEAEGFIRDLGAGTFNLVTPSGPQQVQFDGNTEFSGGTAAELQEGSKVEAEGSIVAGAILADKIKFKEGIRIEGVAGSTAGLTITLRNMSAITVTVDALTRLDDKRSVPSGATDPAVFLADINADDALKIRGRLSGANVLATELEVDDEPSDLDRVRLRGPVDADPAGTRFFDILGVTVDTLNVIEINFRDVNESPIGRVAFFNALSAGTPVQVEGELTSDNDIDASEVELED